MAIFRARDDLVVHYELADYTEPWGQRPVDTFLLHHGYARNLHFWQPWVPLLARDYRVLRFDVRGCGETTTPPPDATFSIDQLVDDAIGLLDGLEIDRVHWVGESSGGVLGLATALRHPERLLSLNLCDTPFRIPTAIDQTYALGEADQAAAIEKYGVAEWCRRTLGYRLDVARAPAGLGEWCAQQMGRTPKHVAIVLHKLFNTVNLWPDLPCIDVPTLIMAGEKSQVARQEQLAQMREHMPKAKLVVFEGCGHGIFLLDTQRCVAEIRSFLGVH